MHDDTAPLPSTVPAGTMASWFRTLMFVAGLILVILSFMVWGYPLISGLTYVYIFGFSLIILGGMRMGQGIAEANLPAANRVLLAIFGLLLFVIGIYAIAFPIGGALTLVFFFAFALVIAGIDRLMLAWAGWPGPGYPAYVRALVIIAGIIAVIFGFVALLYPTFGVTLLFVIISIGILVLGIELIASAMAGKKLIGI